MPEAPNRLNKVLKYGVSPNAPLDWWYGPYNNFEAAITATQPTYEEEDEVYEIHRYIGMTVGILNQSGGVDEYWFKNGIEDEDLIPKVPDIVFPTIDELLGNIKIVKFYANGGIGHQNSELTDAQGWIHLPQCVFTNNGGEFTGWERTSGIS